MPDVRAALRLEGALCAALLARAPALPVSAVGEGAFLETVRACDAADRAFRASIEANLTPAAAREVLSAMTTFRMRVREVRASAAAEASRVARPGVGAGAADPLDVATPRMDNLSHVAAVRLADVSDRARAHVAVLRERANAQIEPALTPAARAALIAAKRARLAAFREAVNGALAPFAERMIRYSETVDSLALVADGWY